MNHIIDKYLNNVQKALHHLIPDEPYLSDLRTNLEEYVQQFPGCTYEDLVSQFGSPENVAQDFIDTVKPNSISHRVKLRKRNILIFITLTSVIIFLLCPEIASCILKMKLLYTNQYLLTSQRTF